MNKIGLSKKQFRPASVLKIKRSSGKKFQSSTISTNNQIHHESMKDFSNEDLISNNNNKIKSLTKEEEEDNQSMKSNIMTSINKSTLNRIKRNSVDILKDNYQINQSSIMFVRNKSSNRLERLHGEDFTPLNNEQYLNHSHLTIQSSTNIYQKTKNNRRLKNKIKYFIFFFFSE